MNADIVVAEFGKIRVENLFPTHRGHLSDYPRGGLRQRPAEAFNLLKMNGIIHHDAAIPIFHTLGTRHEFTVFLTRQPVIPVAHGRINFNAHNAILSLPAV